MTSFPNSPKVARGAIVGIDVMNPLASIIVFQYNPETMRRTLAPQYVQAREGEMSAPRLEGPPRESITMAVEIDATDQLETASFPATKLGVHPTLAALEMLLYPKSSLVIANDVLAAFGVIEVISPPAPMTLLIWGAKRVVPVKLTSFVIDEQQYDPALNPVRAKVDLGLDVLTYRDLGLLSPGGALFMVHQVVKEAMAVIGSVTGPVP